MPVPSQAVMSPGAGLHEVLRRYPGDMTEQELDALIAVQSLKQDAFQHWYPGQTWFAWCSTTGTTLTTTDAAWTAWNSNVASTAGSMAYSYTSNTAYISTGTQWITWNAAYQETEDQRAEREQARAAAAAESEARQERERAERQQAEARSLELLKSLLTGEQWTSYQEKGWFEVRGSSGRRWRVRNRGQSGNVDLMPEIGEEREMSFCAHPREHLPDADAHAAQMLALVTDDTAFERVANVAWRRPQDTPERREARATVEGRAHFGERPWIVA